LLVDSTVLDVNDMTVDSSDIKFAVVPVSYSVVFSFGVQIVPGFVFGFSVAAKLVNDASFRVVMLFSVTVISVALSDVGSIVGKLKSSSDVELIAEYVVSAVFAFSVNGANDAKISVDWKI